MKKSIIILLVTLLAGGLVLSGCSSNKTGLEAIKDNDVLKVGVKNDVPKFGYKDPSTGEIDGFEVDVARRLAKKILGDENKIKLYAVNAKTRTVMLDKGEIDIVAATFTITDERKKSYNFSEPYFTDGVAFLVKKDSGIKSFKDLNNKKIGVAQSATTKSAIEEEGKNQGVTAEIMQFGKYPELKAALEAGRIDCFSVDYAILCGYVDENTEILPDRMSPQDYGIATKLDNTKLSDLINETIEEMKSNGEIDELLEKWEIK